jgi:hypothetical protein
MFLPFIPSIVAFHLLWILPGCADALTFTKLDSCCTSQSPTARLLLFRTQSSFETPSLLHYRHWDYDNDTEYIEAPTILQLPLTLQQQQQQTQQQQTQVVPVQQVQGLMNKDMRDMDRYQESICRRYKRLYDCNDGEALKVFSSASSTVVRRRRLSKLGTWWAFLFHGVPVP